MFRTALACAAFALGLGSATAQNAHPIIVERAILDGKPDLIIMVGGRVKLPARGRDGYLSVRSGPGTGFEEKGRLKPGTFMILLRAGKAWSPAIYADPDSERTEDLEKTCGLPNPTPENWPMKKVYAGPCRSGWVNMQFVELMVD